jgi:hypothetical protein
METVYKVVLAVASSNSGRVELWSTCAPEDILVQYSRNKKVYPVLEGSYLYAFDTLEHAKEYTTLGGSILYPAARLQVWEAKARVIATEPMATMEGHASFWTENKHAIEQAAIVAGVVPTHEGSLWCEWIELVELVDGLDPKFKEYKRR